MNTFDKISDIISRRRTTKPQFYNSQRPVEQELILRLIQNACWAPNHGRTEPWRFLVYAGEGRKKLAELILSSKAPQAKIDKWFGNTSNAPVIIAVLMKRTTKNCKISRDEELMATACAAQNLLLSAEAAGLCSYWSSGIAPLSGSAAKLGFEGEEDLCLGFMHIGWPMPDHQTKQALRKYTAEELTTFFQ